MQYTVLFCNQVDMATSCMVQVDILVNNAGLALGTAGVHQNDFTVFNSCLSSETVSIVVRVTACSLNSPLKLHL